jgi:hypothetical protein
MFPTVIGTNLNKEQKTVPDDLDGEYNVVVVAFQQWHQRLVNSWVPFLQDLDARYADFEYYELPTIRKMNFIYQRFIDGGMRAGIPSTETRCRTITLYIDKRAFKKELAITSEENIHVFLIRKSGEILWRGEGPITEGLAVSLEEALSQVVDSGSS